MLVCVQCISDIDKLNVPWSSAGTLALKEDCYLVYISDPHEHRSGEYVAVLLRAKT